MFGDRTKKPEKPVHQESVKRTKAKRPVVPDRFYKTAEQRTLTEAEKEAFRRIFATLFDQPRATLKAGTGARAGESPSGQPSTAGMSTIERHLLELMEISERRKQFQREYGIVEEERPPQTAKKRRERRQRQAAEKSSWVSDHFENVPASPARLFSPRWMEQKYPSASSADEARERLLRCQSNHELRQAVWEVVFGEGTVGGGASDAGTAFRPLATPFPAQYARLLKEAISLCRTAFRDPYMALSIFEQAKRQGIESYVRGCNTAVYNEMLWVRWEYWKDVGAMEGLANEMRLSGVPFDAATSKIVEHCHDEASSESTTYADKLAGLERLRLMLDEVNKDMNQNRRRGPMGS